MRIGASGYCLAVQVSFDLGGIRRRMSAALLLSVYNGCQMWQVPRGNDRTSSFKVSCKISWDTYQKYCEELRCKKVFMLLMLTMPR